MRKLSAVLGITFTAVLSNGQTPSPNGSAEPLASPSTEQVERLPKRFPPELAAPLAGRDTAKLTRSYCVYRALDTGSLSIKPCQRKPGRLLLAPLFEKPHGKDRSS